MKAEHPQNRKWSLKERVVAMIQKARARGEDVGLAEDYAAAAKAEKRQRERAIRAAAKLEASHGPSEKRIERLRDQGLRVDAACRFDPVGGALARRGA